MSALIADKKHSDKERWIAIYPSYINNKKTVAQGRRVAKDKAVENPTPQEIRDVLAAHGMKFGIENKLYSRENSKELQYRGRIRVQIKKDDGSPLNLEYPSRESIMLLLCDMIPKLKTRAGKQATSEQNQQPQGAAGGGSGRKNKGKGRR